jgi:hypothetical protein
VDLTAQLRLEGLAAGSGLPLSHRLVLALAVAGGGLAGALMGLDAGGSLHGSEAGYFYIIVLTPPFVNLAPSCQVKTH